MIWVLHSGSLCIRHVDIAIAIFHIGIAMNLLEWLIQTNLRLGLNFAFYGVDEGCGECLLGVEMY